MKTYSIIEFWFATVLRLAVLAEIYPIVWLGKEAFAASGDRVLVWVEFIISTLFLLITVSCVFWEWVLFLINEE